MLTHQRLDEIAEEAGRETTDYSGRGMHGKRCVGLRTDDRPLKVLADLVACCNDTEEAAELLRGVNTDDLGLGTILYWPRVRLIDDAA